MQSCSVVLVRRSTPRCAVLIHVNYYFVYIVTLAGACKDSYSNRAQAIDICETCFLPKKLLLFPRQRTASTEEQP